MKRVYKKKSATYSIGWLTFFFLLSFCTKKGELFAVIKLSQTSNASSSASGQPYNKDFNANEVELPLFEIGLMPPLIFNGEDLATFEANG